MKTPQITHNQQGVKQEEMFTLTPVAAPGNSRPGLFGPVWIRLPKSGQTCVHTGLSRSGMNALILGTNPPVRSVSIRKKYSVRGTRLVHLQSLLDFIASIADAQANNQQEESGK